MSLNIARSKYQLSLRLVRFMILLVTLSIGGWASSAFGQPTPTLDSFELSPSTVLLNEPIELSWSSTNATSCTASTSDTYGASGTQLYPPGTLSVGNHTFSMYCEGAGGTSNTRYASVTVQPVPPLSLIGFDSDYTGYWHSSPSVNDAYIVRTSADGNYAGVSGFVLEEESNGTYSLVANPTTSEIAQFDLSSPASIAYELADVNLDGATDMILLNSSNTAAGIVYASTSSQMPPLAFKYIDEDFNEFFAQLVGALDDPDYYVDTALDNGWGDWVPYGPELLSYWDSAVLHMSGQTFEPFGLPEPDEPIPFYSDVSAAYDPNVVPAWCQLNGPGGFRFNNGVWEVFGYYRETEFVPDYTYFSQDAMEVSELIGNYLAAEASAGPIPSAIAQILEDILNVDHDLDDEPAIFNLIRRMGQVLFGIGVEQQTELPQFFAKVELLYTDIGLPALPPFARHAYLQVTFPNGDQYMTRGGPQQNPSFPPFGYIEAQWALNPSTTGDFFDYGATILFRQLVGYTSINQTLIGGNMNMFSSEVNSCNILYLLLTSNSNSYAFQAVPQVSGLPRPRAQAWAPGANYTIQAPCP